MSGELIWLGPHSLNTDVNIQTMNVDPKNNTITISYIVNSVEMEDVYQFNSTSHMIGTMKIFVKEYNEKRQGKKCDSNPSSSSLNEVD